MKKINKAAENIKDTFDVIVIGGGPAGMMAAGTAAQRGAKVLLLEKNKILGKKLLITGGGRCNVLNGELDTRKLISNFGTSDKFLFSTFAQFGVQDTLDFFHSRNMPTIEENLKRVFPATQKSESVLQVLKEYLSGHKVTVQLGVDISRIVFKKGKILKVVLQNGEELEASTYILATGGLSRPETGSTGDGFKWLRSFGHNITVEHAALVPIATKEKWSKRLSGMSLSDVKISLYKDTELVQKKIGKILFTHVGLSGPTILNMSKVIGDLLEYGIVTIKIDLFPKKDISEFDAELVQLFTTESRKKIKNVLSGLVEQRLVEPICTLAKLSSDTFCHSITKEQRASIASVCKNLSFTVTNLLGTEKAVITSGGVPLTEIDTKTMKSKLVENLFVTGDLLDIDRPSGGYSLQLCWTTGYVAGKHSAV